MFDAVSNAYVRFLTENKRRIFYQLPSYGNSGDTLIQKGTGLLLRDLGVKTTCDPRKADIILRPGGNPSMWPGQMRRLLSNAARLPHAAVVIGPATFQFGATDWPDELRSIRKRILGLFARDPQSLANLKQVFGAREESPVIGLAHDPAFYLRTSDWLSQQKAGVLSDYVLAAFRADQEGFTSACRLPRCVLGLLPHRISCWITRRAMARVNKRRVARIVAGLPTTQRVVVCDPASYDIYSFMETVRQAASVHTDRLHVMIAAALLDKPIFAYSTSYGKLEAVYELSMARWADVKFIKEEGTDGDSSCRLALKQCT